MEQRNNIDIKTRFFMNLQNFKARFKLDNKLREVWGSCITRLINLGDKINDNLSVISDEELIDLIKIFDTASIVHDTINAPQKREYQLSLLESLIEQGEAQVSFILSVQQEKDNIAAKQDSKLSSIQGDIDFFETRLIFTNRDISKYISSRNNNLDSKNLEDFLRTYFKEVSRLHGKLKEIYANALIKLSNGETQLSKDEIIANLDRLVKMMYSTLKITDPKTMRDNFGAVSYALSQFEASLGNNPNSTVSPGKLGK